MSEYPNLAGAIRKEEIETIGAGKFQAAYLNWSRTMHHLHEQAPGWLPFAVPAADGSLVHVAPDRTGYLLIGFRHADGRETPVAPQAIMDHRNNAIAYDQVTARDITDTHRRGLCLAAAMFFGLAYELWAGDPIESGYQQQGPSPKADSAQRKTLELAIAKLTSLDAERGEKCRALVGQHPDAKVLHWVTQALGDYQDTKQTDDQEMPQ